MAKIDASTIQVGFFLRKILGPPERYGIDPWVGIWKKYNARYGGAQIRTKFYEYVITHTEPQQENRGKFGDAMAAWQALPPEEKAEWNQASKGLEMYGFNLFISFYMYG